MARFSRSRLNAQLSRFKSDMRRIDSKLKSEVRKLERNQRRAHRELDRLLRDLSRPTTFRTFVVSREEWTRLPVEDRSEIIVVARQRELALADETQTPLRVDDPNGDEF